MMFSVRILPEAEADLEEAKQWYDRQRDGLGTEFVGRVQEVLGRIQIHPELYATSHRDVRVALLRQFPYGLAYRIVGSEIRVHAVFHVHRQPKSWQKRV